MLAFLDSYFQLKQNSTTVKLEAQLCPFCRFDSSFSNSHTYPTYIQYRCWLYRLLLA